MRINMKNLIVDRKVNIQASFGPDDWDLYNDENSEEIAHRLNENLEFLVNNGFPANEVESKMLKMMKEFSKYGAYDSEPIDFLNKILKNVFIS